MANFSLRNLISFFLQKRCLNTCSKISPLHSPLSEISNFAHHFLTNTCSLPLKSAISLSHKFPIQKKNEKKLNSVVNYLKDEGFSQTHISIIVQKWPKVLHSKVETILRPKLEFLKQNGLVGEILIDFLVRNTCVVNVGLGSQMKPALDFLRSYLVCDDKIVFVIRRSPWLLMTNIKKVVKPNIEFLVKQGLSSTCIAKILISQPRVMCLKQSQLIYAFNGVKKLGCQPSSPMFVHAFKIMASLSESTWKRKMEFLQSLGWTQELVLSAFKGYPYIMGYSGEKIRKTMEFYRNTVKFDMQTITSKPALLAYAIDTRVRPRYNVLKILESKKLIKEDKHRLTYNWIRISNERFLDKYVIKYEDNIPGLLDTFSAGKRLPVC